ncbi:MAG: hypothetical protein LBT19_02255 [Candidatus Nomurabacteria bacterium]|jgi:hypothetical protein|nr:hypothetical protein [Candidatus Nomurabacteria bacterium]
MQLVSILVIIVATLTLLTGITVLLGSKPREKSLSILFFLTVLSASLWAYSVIAFLNLSQESFPVAPTIVAAIYISALAMAIAMFGYAAKFIKSKFSAITSIIFAVIGLALSLAIIINPTFLYSSIELNVDFGNIVNLNFDWLYITYIIFFAAVFLVYGIMLVAKILSKPSNFVKNICVLLLVGPGICGIVSLCFDLLLPFFRYDLIWVGPVSIDIAIITFYYAILRYRMIVIRTTWMRIMSYAIFIATTALVYVISLFVVSALLFRGSYLSVETLALNFVMIAFLILLLPIISELSSNVRSLISVNSVDIGYIAKRLNKINPTRAGLKDLTIFLSDHLHFSYIGIMIGDQLYSSKETDFTIKEIEIGAIENKNMPDRIWRLLKDHNSQPDPEYQDLRAIVDLRDTKGQAFGHIIFGSPHDEQFSDDDLMRIEMVISLVATAIDPEKKGRTIAT